MTECENTSGLDIASVLSSSHKRGGCNPPTFGTAPEAKRSLLYFSGADLPALDLNSTEKSASPSCNTGNCFDELDSASNIQSNELVFDCETDHEFSNILHKVPTSNSSKIRNLLQYQKHVNDLSDDVLESESEYTNIANTSDYIGSLLSIISCGASENSYNCVSFYDDDSIGLETDSKSNINVKYSKMPAICSSNNNVKLIADDIGLNTCTNIVDEDAGCNLDKNFNDLVDEVKDGEEEDLLLRNLPTSVDDFQTKEFHLKLERNISSPRNSRRQSPVDGGTQEVFPMFFQAPSLPVLQQILTVNPSSKGSVSSLTGSRTQSLSSNTSQSNFEDLDDNDLEVAMINESFEEQQKQSMIYEQMDLKSLFYGVSSSENKDFPTKSFAQNYVIGSQPSTSTMVNDDRNAEYSDFNDNENATPPFNLERNEFVPLLTPKSRQFVMQRKQQFARSRKNKFISERIQKDTNTELLNDDADASTNHQLEQFYGSFAQNSTTETLSSSEEHQYFYQYSNSLSGSNDKINSAIELGELEELYDEKVQHHRLNVRLKKMMLSTEESDDDSVKRIKTNNFSQSSSSTAKTHSLNCELDVSDSNAINDMRFLEEIAAKAMSEDNEEFAENDKFENCDTDRLSHHPRLPEVLMGLGPSTSSQNFFTIGDTNKTSEVCQFYVSKEEDKSFISSNFHNGVEIFEQNEEFLNYDEASAVAKAVAYGVISSLFESPVPESEYDQQEKDLDDDEKNSKPSPIVNVESEENSNIKVDNSSNGIHRGEEDSSVELSTSILLDSIDLTSNIYDDTTDDLPWQGLIDASNFPTVEQKDLKTSTNRFDVKSLLLNYSHTSTSSLSPSCPSASNIFEFCNDTFENDEQTVPVLDSWENLEDDEELANKMVNKAKLALNKVNAEKNASVFAGSAQQNLFANSSKMKHFESLPHVVEASYQCLTKSEKEITDVIQIISGSTDVWHKKVDDKHFLLIFPNAEKASEALFAKNRTSFMKLKSLENASVSSQNAAIQFKSQLIPRKRRPATTASIARRMIANSLNMRIEASEAQRNKEAAQLSKAKEQKRQKNAIWDS